MIKQKFLRTISLVAVMSLTLSATAFGFSQGNNFQQNSGFNMNSSMNMQNNQQNNTNNTQNSNEISEYMSQKGIMKGDSSGNFNLDSYVKRGDIMLMIVRAFSLISNTDVNFADVNFGSYYYDAIATTKSLGISKGDGNNFNPDKNVTIEEAISLINRSVDVANNNVEVYDDVDLETLFSDSDMSEYATRGQIAEMLYYILTGETDYEDVADEYNQNNYETLATITYTTDADAEVTFDGDDFIDVFEDATSDDLYRVKFTLPSSSYGKLYYDYESSTDYDSLVTSSSKYYVEDDPYISDVTFVPDEDYDGTVSIKYTAYDEDENSYEGIVKIVVGEDDIAIDTITYTTDADTEITFDEDNFIDAFEDATSDDLYRVKFTLPSSSYGKLYYDYESSTDYDSLVTSSSKYYVDDDPYISEVTFVPDEDYDGTGSIKYTAYDGDDNSYEGIVKIVVEEDDIALDTIKYTTEADTEVTFDEDDFIDVFEDATSDDLYRVKFTLPSSSYGKLYYDYESSTDYDSLVTSTSKYYVDDDPYISDVTFVPDEDYDGTVSIKYTAYDENGNSYEGTVKIVVED